ncbi:hypothetical protein FRC04_010618 [Tulasnella sp. 424]|nr:hypothetical protein FRC04_010618 [Tulasnella sp. 424]
MDLTLDLWLAANYSVTMPGVKRAFREHTLIFALTIQGEREAEEIFTDFLGSYNVAFTNETRPFTSTGPTKSEPRAFDYNYRLEYMDLHDSTYTMLLHNWAQINKMLNSLAWEDVATGTNPNLTWTSVIKMDGSGSGARKKQARNLAARHALVALGIVDNTPPGE